MGSDYGDATWHKNWTFYINVANIEGKPVDINLLVDNCHDNKKLILNLANTEGEPVNINWMIDTTIKKK